MNNSNIYNTRLKSFNNYLSITFMTLGAGILISTLFAFWISRNISFLYRFPYISFVGLIAELAIAMYFSFRLTKMSSTMAWTCYIMYAILTGISLSSIFIVYSLGSIVMALATTTVLFICMGIIGYTTNLDLTKFSTLLISGLTASLIVSLLNMFFFHSSGIELVICYASVVIFLGLIAYDMQRLKSFYSSGLMNSDMGEKIMIYGAFQLYLDFINLFLKIITIFGRRSSNSRD